MTLEAALAAQGMPTLSRQLAAIEGGASMIYARRFTVARRRFSWESNGRCCGFLSRGTTLPAFRGGAPRDRRTRRIARERAGVLASSARVRRSYKPPTSC